MASTVSWKSPERKLEHRATARSFPSENWGIGGFAEVFCWCGFVIRTLLAVAKNNMYNKQGAFYKARIANPRQRSNL